MPTATLSEIASVDILSAGGGTLSVEPETTIVLTAIPRDKSGTSLSGHSVVWSSSNQTVASINSATGTVTAISPGSATITATIGARSGHATFQVIPFAAQRVAVSPRGLIVSAGTSAPLSLSVFDRKNRSLAGKQVSWVSSNPNVATVSSTGSVRGVAPGFATVTATVDGVSDNASVSVSPAVVTSVSVSVGNPSIMVGQITQATATPRDASGNAISDRSVVWRSSNNSVAIVSSTGVVSAIRAGTATISATVDGVLGSTDVVVMSAAIASIRVSLPLTSLAIGQAMQAIASARDANDNEVQALVTWSSSNPSAASVSANGVVSAIGVGAVTIVATAGGKIGSATFSVAPFLVAVLKVEGDGPGSGRVDSDSSAINCTITEGSASGSCSRLYRSGASVLLTAHRDEHSVFVKWIGAPGCDTEQTCRVTVTQSLTVKASFDVEEEEDEGGGGAGGAKKKGRVSISRIKEIPRPSGQP